MKSGAFAFVLHSHLPYVRKAGRWPHGEEMIHEAMAETYIPLLNALHELKREGIEPRLTIGLTPILLEQLNDDAVKAHFELFLQERLELTQTDIELYAAEKDERRLAIALFYLDWYGHVLDSFREAYGRDLVGAFKRLQDEGNLDILTSAGTHAYLPLLERDSSIYGQLATGVANYKRLFDRAPRGIWLPECAYRPAYVRNDDGAEVYKPGIEEFLAGFGLRYFFTETHVITGGSVVGKAAGDAIGPYGIIPKRRVVPLPDGQRETQTGTTFRPYYVRKAEVAVFGRDEATGLQVWSAAQGYPGDFNYREFHRKDSRSGLQYWRVTGAGVDLSDKDLYDPGRAADRVSAHADHFVGIVRDRLAEYHGQTGQYGVVVSAYDTELFGHWWFEGVTWLKEVLRRLANHPEVQLTTAADYIAQHAPDEVMSIPESSWGQGGTHWTWYNPETEWIWPLIHHAERKMERLAARFPDASGEVKELLDQAVRELLLLESSDWPFLITTGQAQEYAAGRFQQHLARFNHLAMMLDSGAGGEQVSSFLTNLQDLDNPFPQVDYRVFAEREGKPAAVAVPA